MEVHNAVLRRCKNVSILIDNRLRKRRIEHDKFIIMLEENNPLNKPANVRFHNQS